MECSLLVGIFDNLRSSFGLGMRVACIQLVERKGTFHCCVKHMKLEHILNEH